jgi:enoyl-[acyl-carrier protein] reductase I
MGPAATPAIPAVKAKLLEGKRGLIVGIANDQSIAWGCAKAFRAFGAELAVTYLNDKAKKHVEPLARVLEAPIFMPLDVNVPGQMEAVFERIAKEWGSLDFAVHSIAFSPKEALRDAWSTCRARDSAPPWRCRAGRSSAWRTWPSR